MENHLIATLRIFIENYGAPKDSPPDNQQKELSDFCVKTIGTFLRNTTSPFTEEGDAHTYNFHVKIYTAKDLEGAIVLIRELGEASITSEHRMQTKISLVIVMDLGTEGDPYAGCPVLIKK